MSIFEPKMNTFQPKIAMFVPKSAPFEPKWPKNVEFLPCWCGVFQNWYHQKVFRHLRQQPCSYLMPISLKSSFCDYHADHWDCPVHFFRVSPFLSRYRQCLFHGHWSKNCIKIGHEKCHKSGFWAENEVLNQKATQKWGFWIQKLLFSYGGNYREKFILGKFSYFVCLWFLPFCIEFSLWSLGRLEPYSLT